MSDIPIIGEDIVDDEADFKALEFNETIDEELGVRGAIQRGDRFNGHTVNGTGHGFCPFCRMHLPWKFLVVKNTMSEQSLGYCCSNCLNPLIAVTKIKGTNKIIKKWMDPQLKKYIYAKQKLHEQGSLRRKFL